LNMPVKTKVLLIPVLGMACMYVQNIFEPSHRRLMHITQSKHSRYRTPRLCHGLQEPRLLVRHGRCCDLERY
jgi:hypothetical protein